VSYLIDTSIISELVKPTPDANVLSWAADLRDLRVSVISLDELYCGLSARPSSTLQRAVESYLDKYVTALDVTSVIARNAGIMRGQLARKGRVREQADMLIAATAAAHGLTLATRNERDFEGCGVAIHNPFRA